MKNLIESFRAYLINLTDDFNQVKIWDIYDAQVVTESQLDFFFLHF